MIAKGLEAKKKSKNKQTNKQMAWKLQLCGKDFVLYLHI